MKKKGQVIVEIMIAFAVMVVAVVALVSAVTKSVSNSGVSKRQSAATAYATQGMEWVRGQRDVLGWGGTGGFYAKAGAFCLNRLAWNSRPCVLIAGTEFTRIVNISQVVGDVQQIQAVVTVTWVESARTQTTSQTTFFTAY